MAQLIQHKCPACGASIEFNTETQKMSCPYCDSELDVAALLAMDAELDDTQEDQVEWETTPSEEWQPGEVEGMRVYICQSCGGEVIGDETLASTKCPYCENNVIMTEQFKGDLRPDYVIPFKLNKEDAVEGLKKHMLGKKFLPKVFKDENHIDEVKGLYVPVWLYDTDVDASIRYLATRTSTWSTSSYIYTATSYYAVNRAGTVGFEHVPVDGSKKFEDELMQSLEPYDFSEAVDFQTAYLSGYLADKYDVSSEDSKIQANYRIKESTEKAFRDTVKGYVTVTPERSNLKYANSKCQYALYPVWILNTTWNGKNYRFAMNGQTGKFVGDLPCDTKSYWKYFLTIAGICGGAVLLISWLLFRFFGGL